MIESCVFLRIQLKLNTALLSTVRPCVRAFVTGVTSHISHIYEGINVNHQGTHQTLYILNQNHPGYLSSKTRPDKTISSALTNMTIDFDFELSKI